MQDWQIIVGILAFYAANKLEVLSLKEKIKALEANKQDKPNGDQ
jgi:hypothetical protein